MKKFKFVLQYAVPVWIILVLATVLFIARPLNLESQSSTFCAYGRIFVEFDDGGKRWGTILLNDNGKPIPCDDPTGTPVFNRQKENII